LPSERLKVDGFLLKVRGMKKQYADHLGLTPASRSGVKAKKPVDQAASRKAKYLGIIHGNAAPQQG
jgi:hypothetical protein